MSTLSGSGLAQRRKLIREMYCYIQSLSTVFSLDSVTMNFTRNALKKPWSVHDFNGFLRDKLHMCGVGSRSVTLYSAHYLKRGFVQLYRPLEIRDEQILEIIQMIGANAYANYYAAFKDCAPLDLPRFSNLHDFIEHAATLYAEE